VERYYDRLSKHSKKEDDEEKKDSDTKDEKPCALDKLSYEEISNIAQFLDHKNIENFRRLSKICNYSASFGILRNIQSFSSLI
jgi:hypothetical protein